MMITITHKGNFSKTEKFLKKGFNRDYLTILEKYGREGVAALANATPIDSGETANSWGYKIDHYNGGATISWTNTSIVNGVSIAVLIQYGHGTRNGGYVQGRDYINPAIRPIFDKIANELWWRYQCNE
jgi:hypothetical protein